MIVVGALNRPALPAIVMSVLRSREEQRELLTAFSGISTQPRLMTTDPEAAPKSMLLFNLRRKGLDHLVINKELNTNAACFSPELSGGPHTAQRACPFPWQRGFKSLSSPYLPLNQTP